MKERKVGISVNKLKMFKKKRGLPPKSSQSISLDALRIIQSQNSNKNRCDADLNINSTNTEVLSTNATKSNNGSVIRLGNAWL